MESIKEIAMQKRDKSVIAKSLIAGILACLLAVLFFAVNTFLGADRPFLFRVLSIPVFIPFLLSKPFWPMFWPDEMFYIHEMVRFSLVFYFITGGVIGLAHCLVGRRKFYTGLIGIFVISIAIPTGFYLSDLPHHPQANDYYQIEHKGIAMPLWVRGRIDSGVIVLHLHGGPGDTAIRMSLHPAYRALESKYAVAYWDQPGAGNSRWLTPQREIPMSEVTDALDEVITLIHEKYPDTQLFLLSHSFGGEVGTKFLTEYSYDDRVVGWIMVDGVFNEIGNRELALTWLEQRATARLQEGHFASVQEEQFWKSALEYTRTHRAFEKWYETELWDNYIEPAGGYGYSSESEPALGGVPQYLVGRENFILERVNLRNAKSIYRDALATDYTPALRNINLPTLILWGRHDGAIPVASAWEVYRNIGTEDRKKTVTIFEQSGHNPMLEEPEKYTEAIETFIERTIDHYND